jgi:hypothetical protein
MQKKKKICSLQVHIHFGTALYQFNVLFRSRQETSMNGNVRPKCRQEEEEEKRRRSGN